MARGKVILEKLKGTSDALHMEFVLLLAPKPSSHVLENIVKDAIKETESYLSSVSREDLCSDGIVDCHCSQDNLGFRKVDPLVHESSFLGIATQES